MFNNIRYLLFCMIIRKIYKRFCNNPLFPFVTVLRKYSKFITSDRLYISLMYFFVLHKWPNLTNPKGFNEKLQWMKLHYHKPIFTTMVDKYAAKQYISDKIGAEYVIPLLGVWDRPEDIDFDKLPNQFVLKCNHTSGIGLVICKDKNTLDIDKTIKELNRGLKDDYFSKGREWPYKNVQRKILAEEYREDESGFELKDYKLYCFNGEPKFCQVDFGKSSGITRQDFTRNLYDMDWNCLDIKFNHPNDPHTIIPKPSQYEKMKDFARLLSKGEPFLRVDFYNIGDQILFSEITFYPIAGFGWFKPCDIDKKLGEMINLPQKTE